MIPPRDAPEDRAIPSFSVIVPSHRRPDALRRCLEALSACAGSFEVIVVCDGPSPGLRDALAGFSQRLDLTVLQQPQAGPGAARNTGAARARGRYLVFTADDCRPSPDWLLAYGDGFARRPEHMLGGTLLNELPEDLLAHCNHQLIAAMYAHFNQDPLRARFFTPNNLALPRALFEELGGFDPTMGGTGEDREFCERWRARGLRLASCPAARVFHRHPQDLWGFLRQHVAYGRGSQRYRRKCFGRSVRALLPESPGFYWGLLKAPLQEAPGWRGAQGSLLMSLSQAANLCGVLWELSHPGEGCAPPADGVQTLLQPHGAITATTSAPADAAARGGR